MSGAWPWSSPDFVTSSTRTRFDAGCVRLVEAGCSGACHGHLVRSGGDCRRYTARPPQLTVVLYLKIEYDYPVSPEDTEVTEWYHLPLLSTPIHSLASVPSCHNLPEHTGRPQGRCPTPRSATATTKLAHGNHGGLVVLSMNPKRLRSRDRGQAAAVCLVSALVREPAVG